jgi:capsular polysaccharide biosynthesis protein
MQSRYNQEKVYIKDFIALLIRYKKQLGIIMVTAILTLVQLSFILPKTYKADFEINIYSKYFKNALITEVIPGMNSIAEMTQTVDSMVKEVMNDEFIDFIGTKYKIYPKKMNDNELSKRRQSLREQFEMYSTGGQSYRVSFSGDDPLVAFEVSKLVMERVRSYFINSRIETIEIAKKTILKKLENVNMTKQISDTDVSSNALASKNPNVLRSELSKIDQDISALRMQFNINHPRIVKLQQRKDTIENWLSEIDSGRVLLREKEVKDYTDAPLLMAQDNEIQKNLASKLFAKFNDVNIALDIERKSVSSYIGVIESPQIPTSPLFPKKRIFASLGFLVGLIGSFLYVFYQEVMSESKVEQSIELARELSGSYFGFVPHIDEFKLMSNKPLHLGITPQTAPSMLRDSPPEPPQLDNPFN